MISGLERWLGKLRTRVRILLGLGKIFKMNHGNSASEHNVYRKIISGYNVKKLGKTIFSIFRVLSGRNWWVQEKPKPECSFPTDLYELKPITSTFFG